MELEDSVSLATASYNHDSEDYSQTPYSLLNCSTIYDLVVDEWPPCSWWESEAEVSSDPCIFDDISCNATSAVRGVTSSTATHAFVSWESSPFLKWQIALIGIFAGCVSLVTILGNLIVLLSFILHRNIRQTSNYFIASLAVSDLLIGTISMPLYTVYFLSGKNWPLGETPCDLWLALDYTVCLCSIYTVFCITVDRFCSVTVPARYQTWRTERKVILVLFLVWFVPILVFFTSIIGWQYFVRLRTVPHGKCYVQYMDNALFNCLLQVGYFWVTLIAMCVLYGGIYRVALRLNHRARTRRKRMESVVSIAGETITKIGIGVSKSPTKANADEDEHEEMEVERCDGGVETHSGRGDGIEGREGDETCGGNGRGGKHEENGKEFPATRESREPQEADRNPETCPSPGGQNNHLVVPYRDEFWEEAESKVSGFKRKRCTPTRLTLIERGRIQDLKVKSDDRARVQRSSSRGLVRKAFDNITRAVSSTRTRKLPIVLYDVTGLPSSSDEGYTENCDKVCHDGQNTRTRRSQDVESMQPNTEVERSVEPGCILESDGRDGSTWNDSTLRPFKAESESPDHRVSRRKVKSKVPDNDCGGWRQGFRSRTLSDRFLMRGPASVAEQARRTTRLRTKRANYVARKSLRTITLILGAFVLCWTPWHVLSLIMGFCSGYTPACVPSDLYDVSYWLCYLNSCINPFCYALANQQFKKAFLRILRFDWRRT